MTISNDYTFGIEIEFKGVTTDAVADALTAAGIRSHRRGYGSHEPVSYWKVTTDQTVSEGDYNYRLGTGTGGELISPILQGDSGLAKLEKVLETINQLDGLYVNVSCGIHVHLGYVPGWTPDHVKAIYRRYAAFESDFDSFMPRSRRGDRSRWCGSINGHVSSVAHSRASNFRGLASCGGGKFKKVNLATLSRNAGTIEFRQHSGSTDYDKISNWVRLLIAFAETSKTATAPTVTNVSATATGMLNVNYRPRRRTAYAEIRDQIAAQGWNLRFAGGSVANGNLKYKLFDANGQFVSTVHRYQLKELYVAGTNRLNPETAQRFWDQWFSAPETTSNDDLPQADTVFNGVAENLVQFFTSRREALA